MLKKTLFTLLIATYGTLLAADVTPAECSTEVLFRFFPQEFVLEALKQDGVTPDQADKIATALSEMDREIVQKIEQRASSMNPNPLREGGTQEARAQLFKGVISDLFADVMKKNGVTDQQVIDRALTDIQEMRVKRFEACRKAGMLPKPPGPPPQQ